MDPDAAKHKIGALLDGAMRGRSMYVVPYVMGPVNSPISKVGVEVTDSPYVVANMRIMSRMGQVALERIGSSSDLFPAYIRSAILIPCAATSRIFRRKEN